MARPSSPGRVPVRTVWARSAVTVCVVTEQEADEQQTVRVAAVQAESAWLDLAAGVDKVISHSGTGLLRVLPKPVDGVASS